MTLCYSFYKEMISHYLKYALNKILHLWNYKIYLIHVIADIFFTHDFKDMLNKLNLTVYLGENELEKDIFS